MNLGSKLLNLRWTNNLKPNPSHSNTLHASILGILKIKKKDSEVLVKYRKNSKSQKITNLPKFSFNSSDTSIIINL